jgi:lactonase
VTAHGIPFSDPVVIAEAVVEGFLAGVPTPLGMNPIPEGPAFDRSGRMYFVSAFPDADGYKVFRFDPGSGEIERILNPGDSAFASCVVHRDGRLFFADFFGGCTGKGRLAVAEPDGTGLRTVVDEFEGTPIIPDDLIFTADGVIYYNDFQGTAFDPTGRVIRLDTAGKQCLVLGGLGMPNGIAFTPDWSRLWISEHANNRLISFALDENGVAVGSRVHGYFTGGLLDSLTIDSAGHIYQAIYDGGRVEVLDSHANRLLTVVPGPNPLDEYIRTTHVAIKPGGRDAYLVAGGPAGIGIFKFEALADGLALFSHQ